MRGAAPQTAGAGRRPAPSSAIISIIEPNAAWNAATAGGATNDNEVGLAARLAGREKLALAELYDRFAGRAFGLAYKILQDRHAAEDAVHDAFLWTWENAGRIEDSRGSPGALLLTITRRRAIDARRRRDRVAARESQELGCEADLRAASPLAQVEEAFLRERMKQGLSELVPAQREAVELAYFQGLTQVQIAEMQQVPVGTVKSRLRLAMGSLGKMLGGSRDGDL